MTEPIRLAIVGSAGRMGRELEALATPERGFEVTVGVDADTPGLSAYGGRLDCVIDFSVHTVAPRTAAFCAERGVPLVLGTTGLSGAERAAVERAAEQVAIVWAPNFSIGVNLLFALAGAAARMLGDDYDIEVVEAHHRNKVDAPSGTAHKLGEILAEARGWRYEDVVRCGREGQIGARPDAQIGMSVVRGGDVVGEHSVLYLGTGEQIALTHRATDRNVFALGALRAARWLHRERGLKPQLFDMADVLGVERS